MNIAPRNDLGLFLVIHLVMVVVMDWIYHLTPKKGKVEVGVENHLKMHLI